MALKDIVENIVAEFGGRALAPITPREVELPRIAGKADAIIGMRRTGKTWRLLQEIAHLEAHGVSRARQLYVNLEDERLSGLESSDLALFMEAHYRRYPDSVTEQLYLYLDEVQNVPGWERYVRRLLDTMPVTIAITGSSSRMLSRELATSLRGRSLATELLPFSFREFLVHAGEPIPTQWPPTLRERHRLRSSFDRYLEVGGFPEVQALEAPLRIRVLQDYVSSVVFRDVVERHEMTNIPALRYLVRRLLDVPAGRFSVHRLFNDLKSQGVRVGKDTLYAAVDHLEDAYLLFTVPIDSRSEAVRSSNPKKAYPIDPALAAAHSFAAARNTGHLLESLVYLELRRRGYECAYVKTGRSYEVDFIARRHDDQMLVQVCADISQPETRRREVRALEAAMGDYGHHDALLVTLDETDSLTTDAGTIRVLPAWRWLLER